MQFRRFTIIFSITNHVCTCDIFDDKYGGFQILQKHKPIIPAGINNCKYFVINFYKVK